MAQTLEELEALKAVLETAMARGEQAIEFESRRTEFRNWSDMKAQWDWLNDQIAGLTGDTGKFTRVRYVSTDKDLG
jgi:hypothetical protein